MAEEVAAVGGPWLGLSPGAAIADRLVVIKSQRRLYLQSEGRVLKTYRVALGSNPVGPKVREGDGRTPEGVYALDGRNAESRFHLSLRVSYPGPGDLDRAKALGVSPGGDIMIHGIGGEPRHLAAHRKGRDWTRGCIALTNAEIEEIWALTGEGAVIEIRP
jgi:murein L,D-transpeptidase YafK